MFKNASVIIPNLQTSLLILKSVSFRSYPTLCASSLKQLYLQHCKWVWTITTLWFCYSFIIHIISLSLKTNRFTGILITVLIDAFLQQWAKLHDVVCSDLSSHTITSMVWIILCASMCTCVNNLTTENSDYDKLNVVKLNGLLSREKPSYPSFNSSIPLSSCWSSAHVP